MVHDLETCLCYECSMMAWERSLVKEDDLRGPGSKVIEVQKVKGQGETPIFLGVIQRHYEKAKPAVVDPKKPTTLVAPLEMLEFLCPASLIDSIESLEIIYQKP
jgi:hypothetical protein